MGKLAKLDADKSSSGAFAGCAPLGWLQEKAADFAGWVGKGVFDLLGNIKKNFLSGWDINIPGIKELADKALDFIPGARGVQKSFGVMIAAGAGAVSAVKKDACARAALAALGIAGVVVGGAAAISALGGVGALLGGLAVVSFIGGAARWLLRGVQKAYNFNFNISNKEIQERYKNNIKQIAARLGGVVGTGLASLACGVAPGAAITVINPLALALVRETVSDGWDEMKSQIQSLIATTASAVQEWIVLESFRNVRSAIKKSAASGFLSGILPDSWKKKIEGWGAEGAKPWRFSEKVEEAIENIKDPNIRAFTEEAVEQFMDVCSEQLYALTYAF